jgi:hypothetical protein
MPRGIRNNNPTNIDYHKGTDWLGLDTPPTDGRFCRFTDAVYGLRAAAKILLKYRKRGITSVQGIIGTWAPSVENNTSAYVRAVSGALGVGPSDPIDVTKPAVMRELLAAIVHHENGSQPYNAATIDEAMLMAGITGPRSPTAATA